jgi:hypothetical protein
MDHTLTAEQQRTEHRRTNLAASADAIDDANARLAALEFEQARQQAAARDPGARAGLPYAARARGKAMLRKAPPARSGIVGVLEAGAEVMVEEEAETEQGVARLRVSGDALSGWGNADKFERVQGDEGAAATAEAVAARTPLPLDAQAAVRLFDDMGVGADAVRELFDATAALPATTEAQGREARAGFLWKLLASAAGDRSVTLADLAPFLGRAAARHCLAQPSVASWAVRQARAPPPTEEGVPPEVVEEEYEPLSFFESRAEEATKAVSRAEIAASNLAASQAEVQASMATAMASGELDVVREALSRAAALETELAEQKDKCVRLAAEAEEAAGALALAQERSVVAVALAATESHEDDEDVTAWLGAALLRCFESATTPEWTRPDPSTAVDERWLQRWLCTGPPRRPRGEELLPWLHHLFRCACRYCTHTHTHSPRVMLSAIVL